MNEAVNALEPATRARRFSAGLIDLILVLFFGLILMMATGALDDADDYTNNWPFFIIPVLGLSSYVILNGAMLFLRGQTLAQWLLGIRAVADNGGVPSLWRLIVRCVCFMCVYATPSPVGIFVAVDLAMAFGSERRCLHDRITGTRVVRIQTTKDNREGR